MLFSETKVMKHLKHFCIALTTLNLTSLNHIDLKKYLIKITKTDIVIENNKRNAVDSIEILKEQNIVKS